MSLRRGGKEVVLFARIKGWVKSLERRRCLAVAVWTARGRRRPDASGVMNVSRKVVCGVGRPRLVRDVANEGMVACAAIIH